MKKNYLYLGILLAGSSLISLSSCGCLSIFNTHITFEFPTPIEHGKVQVLNYERPVEETTAYDTIKVEAVADPGYKLQSLTLNGNDISLTPRVRVGKSSNYKIEATFEPVELVKYEGSFTNNKSNYEALEHTHQFGTIPNKGSSNILVVPVEFSDWRPFSDLQLSNLNDVFNGSNPDGTNRYWESVSSFYEKSSYGNVHLHFDIADKYVPSFSSKQFISLEKGDTARGNYKILPDLYNKLTIDGQKVDYKNYDSNKDGYVDGVWLIHNYDDYNGVFNRNNFWAYCHTYTKSVPNLKQPTFSRYANCSQAFMYRGKSSTQKGQDAHTLIHETGHMFGLLDYYTYDTKKTNGQEVGMVGPVGGTDMMDLNIGDHNAYSKFALGWVNPLLVKEDIDIELKPFQETGECIVLPIYPKMTSAFNEYVILEYYTPTNLNLLDSEHYYNNEYPRLYNDNGLKIWHVDSSLVDAFGKHLSDVCDKQFDPNDPGILKPSFLEFDNTASRNSAPFNDGRFNLLEAITPDNVRTYDNHYLGLFPRGASLRQLFIEGDVFNYKNQNAFFIKDNFLHDNQYPFNWSVRVESTTKDGCTISIKNIG